MICNRCKREDPHIDQFLTEEDKQVLYWCGCPPTALCSDQCDFVWDMGKCQLKYNCVGPYALICRRQEDNAVIRTFVIGIK